VIAVNGKVTGAEVFGSSAVLAKAWPKTLRSAAVEALAERTEKAFEPCKSEAVLAFLADAEKGQREPVAAAEPQVPRELNRVALFTDGVNATPEPAGQAPPQQRVAERLTENRVRQVRTGWDENLETPALAQSAPVQVNRVQGKQAVLVESRDKANPGMVIHRSYIAR
jgi:hypothetical protein